MAKCNKKRYDQLPARVGVIDVDYLRFRLSQNQKKYEKLEDEYTQIRDRLDEARERWKAGKVWDYWTF